MNKDKKNKKYNPLGVIAAIVIIFLAEFADSADGIAALIFIAVIVGIAVLLVRKLKPKAEAAARESTEQPHSEGRHISFVPEIHLHSDGSECVNTLHGREKYYAQLDSFLKNGIIDRNEYKFMRERYARMDIPDDL